MRCAPAMAFAHAHQWPAMGLFEPMRPHFGRSRVNTKELSLCRCFLVRSSLHWASPPCSFAFALGATSICSFASPARLLTTRRTATKASLVNPGLAFFINYPSDNKESRPDQPKCLRIKSMSSLFMKVPVPVPLLLIFSNQFARTFF